jgi:hypothetical protein
MSKFDSPAYGFNDRAEVKTHLNELEGFEVPVDDYGTQNELTVPTNDGIGTYEFVKIREVGYEVAFYDEVNDTLVIQPAGDN